MDPKMDRFHITKYLQLRSLDFHQASDLNFDTNKMLVYAKIPNVPLMVF